MPGPSLDQRSVHAEVFARQPTFGVSHRHDIVEERHHHVMLDQPLAVLGEHCWHPDRIIHRQADEPAEQQVVLHLLHQLSLGTDAVEHLQQHGPCQLLRRNARAASFVARLVHAFEQAIQAPQRRVDHLAHGAQRVCARDEVIQPLHREQLLAEDVYAAH
ncbi:hypothetical protein XAUC_01790 [Xanthomonas citri pv. aurantifolii str. ICPB 10535]|nr:hypothetical protein XAUC_01790 [Xanthomonas citri pv. aurantifolii str. ICPB 10535]